MKKEKLPKVTYEFGLQQISQLITGLNEAAYWREKNNLPPNSVAETLAWRLKKDRDGLKFMQSRRLQSAMKEWAAKRKASPAPPEGC